MSVRISSHFSSSRVRAMRPSISTGQEIPKVRLVTGVSRAVEPEGNRDETMLD
jgi:hypothetical protein